MNKDEISVFLETNKIYNEHKTTTLLSSFVVWACVFIAVLFPLFGFGLAFFVMCFLCVGFKKNVLDCLQSKPVKVEYVFNYYKNCISAFCLKVCSMVLVALWSLLLIIPGIVAGLNYSFAPYIFCENPELGTLECLDKSKKLVYGHRTEILLLYLIETLFTCLIAVLSSCLVIIFNFVTVMPLWFNILIPSVITVFVFFVLVLPYFEMYIANIYLNTKAQNQNLNSKRKTSSKRKTAKSSSTK